MAAPVAQNPKKKVVITGICGNLGGKLARHLDRGVWEVWGIEHPAFYSAEREPADTTVVLGDLSKSDCSWRAAFAGAHAVVHFSAVNPYPNASWAESAGSMSHSFNAMLAAAREPSCERFVMASSNHVMGGYKDDAAHGAVKPTDPPRAGTRLRDSVALEKSGDAVAYAAAKLAAERLAEALAHEGTTSFLTLRIGWCQPGENSPKTLSAEGVPTQFQSVIGGAHWAENAFTAPDADVDEAWFKNMWLSNADFLCYFEAALTVDLPRGTHKLVNAMSGNATMRWTLDETQALLKVQPQSDSHAQWPPSNNC